MNKALLEGLSDAIGFVGGALLGFWLGRVLGFDVFASGGLHQRQHCGIVLVGIGGGLGLQAGAPLAAAATEKKSWLL
jgi:hypothetical protein